MLFPAGGCHFWVAVPDEVAHQRSQRGSNHVVCLGVGKYDLAGLVVHHHAVLEVFHHQFSGAHHIVAGLFLGQVRNEAHDAKRFTLRVFQEFGLDPPPKLGTIAPFQ